jgi:hypothetical protein
MEDPLNKWVLGSGPWWLKEVGSKIAVVHEDGEWKVTESNQYKIEGQEVDLESAKAAADKILEA